MDRWSILYLNVNKKGKKGKKKKTSDNRKHTNCIYSKTKVELEHKFLVVSVSTEKNKSN